MSTQERTNFFHLVADIAWFGLAVALTNRFLAFYAIRVGATPLEQGLIVALPGLAMLFSTNFVGWWRRRYPDTLTALSMPAMMFRLVFFLPVLTPLFPRHLQPAWLILSVTLPGIGQGIAGVLFLVMMRESVSEQTMPKLTSRRFLALNSAILVSTIPFALVLEKMPYPINYQFVFMLGFIFTLISMYHVMRVRVIAPTPVPAPRREITGKPLWKMPKFLSIAAVMVLGYGTFYSVFSVTPLHLVKTLGASEGFQAIFGTVELIAGVIAAMFVDRLIYRYGSKTSIVIGMTGISLAAVVFAISPDLNVSLLGALISGGAWTISLVGLFNYFVENTPMEESSRWMTAYQQLVAISTFAGPLIGSTLANWGMGLVIVLMIGALLRFAAAMLIHFNAVDFFIAVRRKRRQMAAVTAKR